MITRPLTAAEKLARARTQLLLNQPFFGTLCIRLKLVPEPGFPTMATNGQRIIYNPGFVEKLSPQELEGVLAHEVLHCALAHHCRRGQRDPGLWNQACDYAVNPILLDNGIVLPAGVLVDPAYRDLSAEEIYARLRKRRENVPPAQPDPANGGSGEPLPLPDADTALAWPPAWKSRYHYTKRCRRYFRGRSTSWRVRRGTGLHRTGWWASVAGRVQSAGAGMVDRGRPGSALG